LNAENFAEWFRRQGHTVIQTTSSYWYDQGPHVYQAFPYHWQIKPSENELIEFLNSNKAIGLRYSTPLTAPTGQISYHVIYGGDTYEIEGLPKKARYDVRKGLEYATYEQISLRQLATDGWTIREDTLIRQGRKDAETQNWWEKLCFSAEDLPGFEAWGAIHGGQLIAGLLAFTCDDCFYILYQQSLTDYLQHGINNALAYVVTREAIKRLGINQVFYGLHSLDAPESVDKFKFRMGYVAKPVRQRVVFHPWLAPAFNRTTYAVVRKLADWSGNSTLAKVEGMVRFYREGKRPLNEQSRPQALENQQLPT